MATEQRSSSGDDLALLVDRAVGGDERAWHALVERLERVVWKAVNMMTPDAEIRDDAFAATWLRLAERLDTIREPQKLPGWLTTTATNEVRQIVRRRNRQPVGALDAGRARSERTLDAVPGDPGDHAVGIIDAEAASEVRSAFAVLDEHCRQVITVLVLTDPPLAYDEASALLGRPIGSLGPTRKRCLEKMRKLLELHDRPSGDRP